MSILIDDLVNVYKPGNCCYRRYNDRKYIAKDVEFCGWRTIKQHIVDSFRVLIGKSRAYHYKEDEE